MINLAVVDWVQRGTSILIFLLILLIFLLLFSFSMFFKRAWKVILFTNLMRKVIKEQELPV